MLCSYEKKERTARCALYFCSFWPVGPPMPRDPTDCATDLSALRRRITELVAQNALSMVQQAIDAVKEEGQYQAIKYLFEMIGLYPAAVEDGSQAQSSLAQTLLEHLELIEIAHPKTPAKRIAPRDPLKLE
jgi:hypothetical protein